MSVIKWEPPSKEELKRRKEASAAARLRAAAEEAKEVTHLKANSVESKSKGKPKGKE